MVLFSQAESIFAELEHHQIVLESLLQNQSAGSFYDEIIKWQNTLQNVEAVLFEWNQVQINWQRLESVNIIISMFKNLQKYIKIC